MTNIKRRIITIKGNIEEREELEVAEMETVRLEVAAEITREIGTTKEKVILKRETMVETPEIDAQAHLEVAVAVHPHQGDDCTEINQIIIN